MENKNEWRKVKLGEIAQIKGGKRLPKGTSLQIEKNSHPYIRIKDMSFSKNLELNSSFEYVPDDVFQKIKKYIVKKNDIILSIVGSIGLVNRIGNSLNMANLTENCVKIITSEKIIPDYLYYYLISNIGKEEIKKGIVGAVQPKLPIKNIENIELNIYSLNIQTKITKILSDIDEKIELNNKINDNLEKLIFLIYQNIFSSNIIKKECKMNEYFDISIGKTPPRKNQEYFSNNSNNNLWVSILDMKSSGIYINKSSEYLTDEAIKKCNIKIIPKNTLLLSFKLTIGRITITSLDKTTTNEAIAHFLTDKKGATEYLYCYLKKFNFSTLGSTSSIATAVNSKIIKEMPFIVPQEKDLENFYNLVKPLFENIKNNQIENEKLTNLKNYLLPKLMNGEIDVENIEL